MLKKQDKHPSKAEMAQKYMVLGGATEPLGLLSRKKQK